MITQEIENLYNNLPLVFFICFILQFIGIIRHYKVNIYSLGYLIYFPIWLFVLFAILGAICALCFKKDDYLMIMLVIVFPILSIVYISVSIAIFFGKWTLNYIRVKNLLFKRSETLDLNWIVSMQPIKKQKKSKEWTEEGIKQKGIQEESYSKAEQFLGRNIKTNSDFIKKSELLLV